MTPADRAKPRRIQRRRVKGWKMPPNTVYVGRPTKWGNDWTMPDATIRGFSDEEAREWLVRMYEQDVEMWRENGSFPDLSELRGKDLACWCQLDQPCHADVLLEIANAD